MALTMQGGASGVALGVDSSHRAKVDANSLYKAAVDGLHYAVPISQTPTGADDIFIFIRNLMGDYDIYVDKVVWQCDSDETVYFETISAGTAAGGGSAVTVTNLTSGGTALATTSIETYTDPEVTGLTANGILGYQGTTAESGSETMVFDSPVVLKQNQGFACVSDTGTAAIVGTVFIHLVAN